MIEHNFRIINLQLGFWLLKFSFSSCCIANFISQIAKPWCRFQIPTPRAPRKEFTIPFVLTDTAVDLVWVVFCTHGAFLNFVVKDNMWVRQNEHQNCIRNVHGEEIQQETKSIPKCCGPCETRSVKSCSRNSHGRTS